MGRQGVSIAGRRYFAGDVTGGDVLMSTNGPTSDTIASRTQQTLLANRLKALTLSREIRMVRIQKNIASAKH